MVRPCLFESWQQGPQCNSDWEMLLSGLLWPLLVQRNISISELCLTNFSLHDCWMLVRKDTFAPSFRTDVQYWWLFLFFLFWCGFLFSSKFPGTNKFPFKNLNVPETQFVFCLYIMVVFIHFVCLQAVDLSKPIDKRIYKGTQPTCHDFNQYSATAESVALIVGFSAGQVQYLDPIKKETSKLFNEEVLYLSVSVCLYFLCAGESGRGCSSLCCGD